jgi:hypothetical protein
VGEEYQVKNYTLHRGGADYYPLIDDTDVGIGPEHCEVIQEQPKFPFKVRCIDNEDAESYLTVGNVYVVTKMYLDEDYYIGEVGGYWSKKRFEIINESLTEQPAHNKYMREVKPGVWIDVYDVLRAWNVVDPCLQHLLKKALASGQRGHKDLKEDLDDILASAKRAVEMHEEWNGNS